jgi:hypothetical protein
MKTRRARLIAASAAVLLALVPLIVVLVRSGGDGAADAAAATGWHGSGANADTRPSTIPKGDAAGTAGNGDGETAGGSVDETDGDQTDPLAIAPNADPGVDDEIALDTYCSIDTEVLDGLPRLRGDGEVTADGLRDALVLLSDRQQEWSFAAFGRPGFESLVTLVDDLEVQWEAALAAFDSGEPEAAHAELEDGDAVLADIQARLDAAAVECP